MPKKKIEIIQEFEGATQENLKDIIPVMLEMGFGRIIVHRDIYRLVDDSIYIFCKPLEGAKFTNSERIIFNVKLPFDMMVEQSEFHKLPSESNGILRFTKPSGDTIGWYNLRDNVLYISDLTHPAGIKARQPMELVLTIIKEMKDRSETSFREWAREFENTIIYGKIMLGADPEQELADSEGSIISANTVFPGGVGPDKKLGHNGHARVCEMRPDPQDDPLKLTDEFEKLVKQTSEADGFLSDGKIFVGGGKELQIGGHIHISGIRPTDQMLDYISGYIARPMDRSQGGVRKGSNFARYGKDSERVRWSNDDHWEYRPLMAYHFDKKTTNAVHCTFFCVLESFRRCKEVLTNNPGIEDYKKLWGYDKYGEHIDNFVELFVNGVVSMEGIDILDRWIPNRGKSPRVNFTNSQSNCPDIEGVQKLLSLLRAKPFLGIKKGVRVNIQVTDSSAVLYYGLNRKASAKFKKELEKKWWMPTSAANIAEDGYGKRTWHFVFQLPRPYLSKDSIIEELAGLLHEAIQISLTS